VRCVQPIGGMFHHASLCARRTRLARRVRLPGAL
jgi:hypothetical protein